MTDRERKTSIKRMLENDLGVKPELVIFRRVINVIEHIDEHDGIATNALSILKVHNSKRKSAAIHQNIKRLIQELSETNKHVYKEITGVSHEITPRVFIGRLYDYWEENHKED